MIWFLISAGKEVKRKAWVDVGMIVASEWVGKSRSGR